MRARDLAEVDYPSVTLDSGALAAARLVAGRRLPGLVVVDDGGEPHAILPASRLLRALLPEYVMEDPTLAAVVDEHHADRMAQSLADRTVRDVLPTGHQPPPVAAPDDTVMEVAALMARERSPLVAVVERAPAREGGGSRNLGVITAAHLLDRLLGVA